MTLHRYARKSVDSFRGDLCNLDCLLTTFFSLVSASDTFEYTSDLIQRKKNKATRLSDIIDSDYWGMHKPLLPIASTLLHFGESQVFKNFFKASCNPANHPLSVLEVATKAAGVPDAFIQQCKKQMDTERFATVTLASLEPMWGGIRNNILSIYTVLYLLRLSLDPSQIHLRTRLLRSRA